MKNVFFLIAVMLVVSGCAHHDTKPDVEHHHHDQKQASFDGKCAYSVAHDKMDISGKPEYSFEHAGMTYYFASEEKMNLFKKDLDKNVKAATRNWDLRSGRH